MQKNTDFNEFNIRKNQPKPNTGRVSEKWDRLIDILEAGDDMRMDRTEANSFTNRARKAGYVIVLKKEELTEEQSLDGVKEYIVWFGGRKK